MKKSVTFLATLVLAAGAHAGCYTVLGPKGQVLQESSTPPVNMAYQLHQTVPYAYGQGSTMVFGSAERQAVEAVAAQRLLGRFGPSAVAQGA